LTVVVVLNFSSPQLLNNTIGSRASSTRITRRTLLIEYVLIADITYYLLK
jgi:hypothetical protein